MEDSQRTLSHLDYTVGWICALPKTELAAAVAMLDEEHPILSAADPKDENVYRWGRIGGHNVVIACLPAEQTGKVSAATVAKDMLRSFPAIRFGLMVGIGGGAPHYESQTGDESLEDSDDDSESDESEDTQDIRLGDVVVSLHSKSSEAVVQYDFGKSIQAKEFIRAGGQLNKPPQIVLAAVSQLQGQHERKGRTGIPELLSKMHADNPGMTKFKYPGAAKDQLFKASAAHLEGKKCDSCRGFEDANLVKRKKRSTEDPRVHYGTIGSADQVMKDAILRDLWSQRERIICFEMEAAGLMDSFPCLVIRGICDYADSHKNKIWQPYAAAVAASYAKELLLGIPAQRVVELPPLEKFATQVVNKVETWRRADEEERCIQTFRTTDYEYQKDFNPDRENGTCHWCLHNPTFKNWQHSNTSCLLWITANPGCGKSVLAKAFVDERLFGLEPGDTTICYYFFKDTSHEARSPVSAIAALLHQVLVSNAGKSSIKHALPLFKENGKKTSENMNVMWSILKNIAMDAQRGRMIFILDALDECEQTQQKSLIERLTALERDLRTAGMSRDFKFLITSRPYWSIEREFSVLIRSIPGIRLKGENLSKELHMEMNHVVQARIARLAPQFASQAAREELTRGILATENRTYLWLHLTFLRLAELTCIDRETVKRQLMNLPKTIEDIYDSILLKATDQHRTKRLLQIILAATRPLKVEEVGVALLITEETKAYRDLELPGEDQLENTIRNTCGLFVHIVNGIVLLIHQSAKDFLLMQNCEAIPVSNSWKSSLDMPDSHLTLAMICTSFLRLEELQSKGIYRKDDAPELVSAYHFLEYAASQWMVHLQESKSEDSQTLSLAFVLCDADIHGYMCWVAIALPSRCLPVCNRLQIVSFLGVESIVRRALNDPQVDVNDGGEDQKTPLQLAVLGLKLGTVQLLLQHSDIDVNKADKAGLTPLRLAVVGGKLNITNALLQAPGIDVNKSDSHDLTPLRFAIVGGNPDMVSALIRVPDIKINYIDGLGFTPLRFAIAEGNAEIANLLLQAPRIKVNQIDGTGFTPLRSAVVRGKLEMVKLLLRTPGIDVNKADAHGFTPLGRDSKATARVAPRPSKMQRLQSSSLSQSSFRRLDEVAYAMAQGPANFLYFRSDWKKDSLEITSLLLQAPGIDVNIVDEDGMTPLHRAVDARSQHGVRLLIATPGINVNVVDKRGRTPLAIAMYYSDFVIEHLLLAVPGINTTIPRKWNLMGTLVDSKPAINRQRPDASDLWASREDIERKRADEMSLREIKKESLETLKKHFNSS